MLNVFISYERESKRLVGPLADDIKVLGHTGWFDQELSGGKPGGTRSWLKFDLVMCLFSA